MYCDLIFIIRKYRKNRWAPDETPDGDRKTSVNIAVARESFSNVRAAREGQCHRDRPVKVFLTQPSPVLKSIILLIKNKK